MPRKRKASAARAEGLRAAHEALSAKRLRFTPENSDLSGDSGVAREYIRRAGERRDLEGHFRLFFFHRCDERLTFLTCMQ